MPRIALLYGGVLCLKLLLLPEGGMFVMISEVGCEGFVFVLPENLEFDWTVPFGHVKEPRTGGNG